MGRSFGPVHQLPTVHLWMEQDRFPTFEAVDMLYVHEYQVQAWVVITEVDFAFHNKEKLPPLCKIFLILRHLALESQKVAFSLLMK
jgi:hypothetical protein